jgi:hypothetical protein
MLPNIIVCLSLSINHVFSTVSINHYMSRKMGVIASFETNLEQKIPFRVI